jgi:nucleotide-binding universal stress UspA family protein
MCEALSHVPADVPVTTVLATPPLRHALMAEIKRGGHDLVVMGAPARGPVRAAFGSLSNYLVRRSLAPVLVVQGPPPRGRAITRLVASRTRTRRWATRSRVA